MKHVFHKVTSRQNLLSKSGPFFGLFYSCINANNILSNIVLPKCHSSTVKISGTLLKTFQDNKCQSHCKTGRNSF